MGLLDELKALQRGELDKVKNLYPLNRWLSGAKENLPVCRDVNRLFFHAKPDWLIALLYCRMDPNKKYIKYPKPKKYDNKKYDVLARTLQKKYNWSEKETEIHKQVIIDLLDDNEYIERLANEAGWEKKEKKLFKLKTSKFKGKKYDPRQKGLDSW